MGGRKDLITAGLALGSLAAAEAKAKGKMSAIIATESGSVASFPDGTDAPVVGLTAAIVPVQSGSGDPSPENIRPISGWTGMNVHAAGNNLLNVAALAPITSKGSNIRNGLYWTVPGTYTVSAKKGLTQTVLSSRAKTAGGTYGTATVISTGGVVAHKTYTIAPGDTLIIFDANQNTLNVTKSYFEMAEMQLEYGDTETDYVPYQGTTYPVSWQTEAGTVYGGTLDVTTGTLTVTMANIASYNGETLPGAWISDRDVYSEGTTPTIGAQVVYELAAPIVYHLTPVEIRTLAGQNTIWADTGSVTVKYTADTKAFIDKYIAARRNG